jgi:hypothetical protein
MLRSDNIELSSLLKHTQENIPSYLIIGSVQIGMDCGVPLVRISFIPPYFHEVINAFEFAGGVDCCR